MHRDPQTLRPAGVPPPPRRAAAASVQCLARLRRRRRSRGTAEAYGASPPVWLRWREPPAEGLCKRLAFWRRSRSIIPRCCCHVAWRPSLPQSSCSAPPAKEGPHRSEPYPCARPAPARVPRRPKAGATPATAAECATYSPWGGGLVAAQHGAAALAAPPGNGSAHRTLLRTCFKLLQHTAKRRSAQRDEPSATSRSDEELMDESPKSPQKARHQQDRLVSCCTTER